jgi:hypothetical protein
MSGQSVSERGVDPRWPALPLDEWQATLDTVHMWLQIVGKIKLTLVPFQNQWWHIGLHPTPRGLRTGIIPYHNRSLDMEFDFFNHQLAVREDNGRSEVIPLRDMTVADCYDTIMTTLEQFDCRVDISLIPVEVPHRIPLNSNRVHGSYDPDAVSRWWRINLNTTQVLQRYNSRFNGKSSPILFFWGSFDLAQTRFSGRPATPPSGVPLFFQLAENEENVACGFWPGNTSASGQTFGEPAFYSYIYPAPDGYSQATVQPDAAYFDTEMGEFLLRYEDVRLAPDPEQLILDFFESTYEAAADHAEWDRERLESPQRIGSDE